MITELLYTWVDVQVALQKSVNDWPKGLGSARAYWDGVVIEYAPDSRDEVASWLANLFGPRWGSMGEFATIRLESSPGTGPRSLQVNFDELAGEPSAGAARRTFRLPDTALRRRPLPFHSGKLAAKVFAWHSFKGGVGRTTTALAFARMLAKSAGSGKVLLVDMDFEAPGITWMIETSRMGRPDIAMSDVLALIHGAPADDVDRVLDLVAERLRSTSPEGLIVLPALRPHQREVHIRPEHLEAPGILPLADLLGLLASKLNASFVVADLRAGRSELAATLLLDTRVDRVLVTLTEGQSLKGTAQMLADIAATFPQDDSGPPFTVLVSQVEAPASFDQARDTLVAAASEALRWERPEQEQVPLRFTAVDFSPGLRHLPLEWDVAMERLEAWLELDERVGVDMTLPQWAVAETGREPVPSRVEIVSADRAPSAATISWDERRRRLLSFVEPRVVAEAMGEASLFPAQFLTRLVHSDRYKLPVAVMIGEKGSGKTFTFLQLVHRRSWKAFTSAIDHSASADGVPMPVLWPGSLEPHAKRAVEALLGGDGEADRKRIAMLDRLKAAQAIADETYDWRTWWVTEFAIRAGKSSPDELISWNVSDDGDYPLFVLDGLEELLPDVHTNRAERLCLRALLQEVPAWLRSTGHAFGLLVFVRSDYVSQAITQNRDQFVALYRPYELWWDHPEARRFVEWVADQSKVLEGIDLKTTTKLAAIWGTQTGSGVSPTAPMDTWVTDAMSTRKESSASALKARDVVRLLKHAAAKSIGQPDERILTWTSIRAALESVGRAKLDELREQYPSLRPALDRVAALKSKYTVPFQYNDLPEDEDRLALLKLEENEIAFRERDKVWLIPLYRRGLGLRLAPRLRERVFR